MWDTFCRKRIFVKLAEISSRVEFLGRAAESEAVNQSQTDVFVIVYRG